MVQIKANGRRDMGLAKAGGGGSGRASSPEGRGEAVPCLSPPWQSSTGPPAPGSIPPRRACPRGNVPTDVFSTEASGCCPKGMQQGGKWNGALMHLPA